MKSKRQINQRTIELTKELEMHMALWKNDVQFKNLHQMVKESFDTLEDALRVSQSLKDMKALSGDTAVDRKAAARKLFISKFKKSFLEMTDFDYEDKISPVTSTIIGSLSEKLLKQGSDVAEYIEWFYEFLKQDCNKKLCPPNINLAISNTIVNKFLFENKDKFKRRNRDTASAAARMKLITTGAELFEITHDEEVGKQLMKFGENKVSYQKTFDYLERYAEHHGFETVSAKLKVLKKGK